MLKQFKISGTFVGVMEECKYRDHIGGPNIINEVRKAQLCKQIKAMKINIDTDICNIMITSQVIRNLLYHNPPFLFTLSF